MPLASFILRRASFDMRRGVLAVIVGYLTAVVLSVAGFALSKQMFPTLVPEIARGEILSTSFLIITLAISVLSAVAGGYAMAFMVRSSERILAVYLGLVVVIISALTMVLEGFVKPLWWYGILFILSVPCTVLGASLSRKKQLEKKL